jgi:hypothetical protein
VIKDKKGGGRRRREETPVLKVIATRVRPIGGGRK